MPNITLTSPDLAVGEELQIQVVNGDGVVFLTIIGAPGAGGTGTVTDVAGAAPIVITGDPTTTPTVTITPATDGAAGSMSAADKTKLDAIADTNLWPFDATIPASAVNPELAQAQAVAGAGQAITMRTQAAATGSGAVGGNAYITLGKGDGAALTHTVLLGNETVVGGAVPPTTNYYGAVDVSWNQTSEVIIVTLGRGTNGIGGSVAAVEISAFSEMNLATEGNNSPINIQPASSFGGQAFFAHEQDPSTGLPILILSESPGDPVASEGVIRFAYDTSGTAMGLLVQRDVSNSVDFEMLSRHFNELYYGGFSENNRYHAFNQVLFELLNAGGVGWNFSGPNGSALTIAANAQKTVSLSTSSVVGKDSQYLELYSGTTTSTTPAQPLISGTGIITRGSAAPGTVTKMAVNVIGVDQTTGESSWFHIEAGVKNVAGVVSIVSTLSPTGIVTNADHSAAAAAVTPLLQVVSSTLNVFVTPWSANSIHWSISVDNALANAGVF